MFEKIKKWLFPKEEEFTYRVLVQEQPERKVEVVKKAATKKAPAKKKPATKKPAPAKKPAKKTTKKK
ncbi:MAG: hypothetical protein EB113_07170 [Actinobacteria bacterium]|nr:hypothetical protein [Actinomycetota bacterium]